MASSSPLSPFAPLPLFSSPIPPPPRRLRLPPPPPSRTRTSGRHRRLLAVAMVKDLLGDFGARDPFDAEIASNFGDKVLGAPDTVHKILIPNLAALSLAHLACQRVPPSQPPMAAADARKLLNKVVGWRMVAEGNGPPGKLECLWKVRDFGCGVELINRIRGVVESDGHLPCLHLEHPNQVRAELWTQAIGGLSMNDFIVAAKIDEINTLDLIPKKRVWA